MIQNCQISVISAVPARVLKNRISRGVHPFLDDYTAEEVSLAHLDVEQPCHECKKLKLLGLATTRDCAVHLKNSALVNELTAEGIIHE